jgi:hypothetical protein
MPVGSHFEPRVPTFAQDGTWAWRAQHVLIRSWEEVCRRFGVKLRIQTKWTLCVLLDHVGTDHERPDMIGKCFLLTQTVACEAGKGKRAVQTDLARLNEGKLIKSEPRHGRANIYNLRPYIGAAREIWLANERLEQKKRATRG